MRQKNGELISELEDRMMKITAEGQNKDKRMTRLSIVSEPSETILNTLTLIYRIAEEGEKGSEKII